MTQDLPPDQSSLLVLTAVVRRPGSRAAAIGSAYQAGARLRRLREAGLVEALGSAPARWYPTPAGKREVSRRSLLILREHARTARREMLATMRRAEELFAFADALCQPGRPRLCMPRGGQRPLSFGELASRIEQGVGCEVLVSIKPSAVSVWPSVSPITAVGTIRYVEEERERDVGDWRLNVSVDDSAFVEFSRRRFERATEDATMNEIDVRQAGQTTVLCFEF